MSKKEKRERLEARISREADYIIKNITDSLADRIEDELPHRKICYSYSDSINIDTLRSNKIKEFINSLNKLGYKVEVDNRDEYRGKIYTEYWGYAICIRDIIISW